MFERKNQNILSEHYNKLVDHSGDNGDDSESDGDFITLKRADHDLPDDGLPESAFMSKRKLKFAQSKKALAKNGPQGTKLIFDDDGVAHPVYELQDADQAFKNEDVKEAGRKFAEGERVRLKVVDLIDKEEAKEKKREKKRKRKEREREVRTICRALYVKPLFIGVLCRLMVMVLWHWCQPSRMTVMYRLTLISPLIPRTTTATPYYHLPSVPGCWTLQRNLTSSIR